MDKSYIDWQYKKTVWKNLYKIY